LIHPLVKCFLANVAVKGFPERYLLGLPVNCYLIPRPAFGVIAGFPVGTFPLVWFFIPAGFVIVGFVFSPALLLIGSFVFFVPGGPYGLRGPRLPPVVGHGIFERLTIGSLLLAAHPSIFTAITDVTEFIAFGLALSE
jgi:hypothetical protein